MPRHNRNNNQQPPAPANPPAAAPPAPAATPNPPSQSANMKWYTLLPLAILLMLATWWAADTRYANMYGIAPQTVMAPAAIPVNGTMPAGTPVGGSPSHVVQTNVNLYHMIKFNPSARAVGQVNWYAPGALATNPKTWRICLLGHVAEYKDLEEANKALEKHGLQILPGPPPVAPSSISGFFSSLGRKWTAFWSTH